MPIATILTCTRWRVYAYCWDELSLTAPLQMLNEKRRSTFTGSASNTGTTGISLEGASSPVDQGPLYVVTGDGWSKHRNVCFFLNKPWRPRMYPILYGCVSKFYSSCSERYYEKTNRKAIWLLFLGLTIHDFLIWIQGIYFAFLHTQALLLQ